MFQQNSELFCRFYTPVRLIDAIKKNKMSISESKILRGING